jgi:hypothetical protein
MQNFPTFSIIRVIRSGHSQKTFAKNIDFQSPSFARHCPQSEYRTGHHIDFTEKQFCVSFCVSFFLTALSCSLDTKVTVKWL